MNRLLIASLFVLSLLTAPAYAQLRPDSATATGHSHTDAATITLTHPAGGQNLYTYITGINVYACAGASAVTAAAPTYITTTNLTGGPQFQVGSTAAAGTCNQASFDFNTPLKSTDPGTDVTFVLPTFKTNQVISVNVYYYFGQ